MTNEIIKASKRRYWANIVIVIISVAIGVWTMIDNGGLIFALGGVAYGALISPLALDFEMKSRSVRKRAILTDYLGLMVVLSIPVFVIQALQFPGASIVTWFAMSFSVPMFIVIWRDSTK